MTLTLPIPKVRNPFKTPAPTPVPTVVEHKVYVQVDQSCIDKGVRGDQFGCPVALALHNAGYKKALVGRYVAFLGGYPDMAIPLPIGVFDRVFRYDAGMRMQPFDFELKWTETILK